MHFLRRLFFFILKVTLSQTNLLIQQSFYRDAFDLKYGVGILRIPEGLDINKIPDESGTNDDDDDDSDREEHYDDSDEEEGG